jgi:hypothetical protein
VNGRYLIQIQLEWKHWTNIIRDKKCTFTCATSVFLWSSWTNLQNNIFLEFSELFCNGKILWVGCIDSWTRGSSVVYRGLVATTTVMLTGEGMEKRMRDSNGSIGGVCVLSHSHISLLQYNSVVVVPLDCLQPTTHIRTNTQNRSRWALFTQKIYPNR